MLVKKIVLRIIGALGAVIFLAFFAITFAVPEWVENSAANFIEEKAREKVDRAIDGFTIPVGDNALGRLADSIVKKNQGKIDNLKAALKEKAHERMADSIAQIRNLDCECRDKYAKTIKDGFEFDLAVLQGANDRVVDFIHTKYMEVTAELKRDIRIFTGVNALVFVLLIALSYLKPRAVAHLMVPAGLLTVATIVCSYFYIFEQNWLLTIIYSDYLGFGYLIYLGVVFLFFCDVALNRGRVTAEIINAMFNAIGSVASVGPC